MHRALNHVDSAFFNNVAVATRVVQKDLGVEKVCIFDWDVHHGDGTQEIFYDDPNVLYVSLHRYDYSDFYPHKEDADPSKIGSGKGTGFNVNVAWNNLNSYTKSDIGDKEYKFVCSKLLYGIIKEFRPEVIIISAGFDAAKGDPLGMQQVTPKGYDYMTRMLKSICPKVFVALEGGYNLKSISVSAEATVKGLLKDEYIFDHEDIDMDTLRPRVFNSIKKTAFALKDHWKTAKQLYKTMDEF